MDQIELGLTPKQNARLDQLLSRWYQHQQLPTDVVDSVRRNALATTESLSGEWWVAFEEQMARLFASVNLLPHWGDDMRATANQQAQMQWPFNNYQQDYWRPGAIQP